MKVNVVTSLDRKDVLECLRLWSLQKTLKKRDFYVQIIDVQTEAVEISKAEKESFQELFPNYTSVSSHQELASLLENGGMTFVTGDKVWKSKTVSLAKKALVLKGIKTRKIAYNVGVDGTEYGFLEKGSMKKYIGEFEHISVSSKEDKDALSQYSDKEIPVLCDNTLLLRNKEYDVITNKFRSLKDYILLDSAENDPKLLEFAKKVKKETGLKLVILGGSSALLSGIQGEEIKTSQKFLGIVKGAKYVITDSDRSLLFAMIFKRPFLYVKPEDKVASSIKDLLTEVKLDANLLSSVDDYEGIAQFKLRNGHALHRTLSECKKDAYAYLDKIKGVERNPNERVDAPTDILKKDCCACYACEEVCPVAAITMTPDKKGFYYPVVDPKTCISCGMCKKACVVQKPRLVEYEESFPKAVAAYNKDLDVRKGSTSGAMFPVFAKYIIEEKQGYVGGAKYDEDMNVVSAVANTMEGVKAFYGSKYCKGLLDDSFKRIKELLDQGEYVLFSGLPCECSGLRGFLKKDYEKLYICEILCHAGPSAKVFKAYVKYLEDKFNDKITHVTFRQKKTGWEPHQTSMVVEFKNREPLRVVNRSNNYHRAFANDYIAREGCASCRFTHLNRAGDVTVGDFWGIKDIHPDMYDNQGASMVLINNQRGLELWNAVKDNFEWSESTVKKAFKKNHSKPISYKIDQDEFFDRMNKGEPIDKLLEEFNDLK